MLVSQMAINLHRQVSAITQRETVGIATPDSMQRVANRCRRYWRVRPGQLLLVEFYCVTEVRVFKSDTRELMFFENVVLPQFGLRPHMRCEALANGLAADLDSAIVIAVADVLQQVRHFGK